MSRRRDSLLEVQRFQRRVDRLMAEEAVCPDCVEARAENARTMAPPVCDVHARLRERLAGFV